MVPMLYSANRAEAALHSSTVSPPQNCAKMLFLINQPMGKPIPNAKFVKVPPILTIDGLPINLKSQYDRRNAASSLPLKAMAVFSNESGDIRWQI